MVDGFSLGSGHTRGEKPGTSRLGHFAPHPWHCAPSVAFCPKRGFRPARGGKGREGPSLPQAPFALSCALAVCPVFPHGYTARPSSCVRILTHCPGGQPARLSRGCRVTDRMFSVAQRPSGVALCPAARPFSVKGLTLHTRAGAPSAWPPGGREGVESWGRGPHVRQIQSHGKLTSK